MAMPRIAIDTHVRYTPQVEADPRSLFLTATDIWVVSEGSADPNSDEMHFAAKMPDGTTRIVKAFCRDFTAV
jgi:hypothetical protein